ncbi:MAG: hypothetical protein DME26_12335 [Verrucomicrobia bacterium]|nr:MAG: hypothetical protein DME26_12335 [Verrucomicrobiota bacterium]
MNRWHTREVGHRLGQPIHIHFLPTRAGDTDRELVACGRHHRYVRSTQCFRSERPGATWQYQFIDSTPPYVQSLTPLPRATVAVLTNIVVTFSEAVTGVNASDLIINTTPATGLSGSGAGPYRFTFPQPPQGTVVVSWSGSHGIRDLGNNPFAGGSWNYVLDTNSIGIVISEIMYHPISENPLDEYIELFNRDASPVNLSGWRISHGVDFTFPNVMIPAGGYLVVAPDVTTFKSKYTNVMNVVGNWAGTLSNSREDIDLDDARGNRVDSVRYADEGDWAIRRRGAPDYGHRGWGWFAEHDGLGKSAELINPVVSNNSGQNWASSLVPGGTPGTANSVFATNIAPLIRNVAHSPIVPKPTDLVLVTAELSDESDVRIPVTLYYRADRATPPPFTQVAMRDDGLNGDASAGDGIYSAVLPAQANNTVVEFYLSASDLLGNARTWPAPAIAAEDGTGPTGQVANALYQV